MANEPALIYKRSRPKEFYCSICDEPAGKGFDTEGWATDVIEAFRLHVRRYHENPTSPSRREIAAGRTSTLMNPRHYLCQLKLVLRKPSVRRPDWAFLGRLVTQSRSEFD